MDLKKVRNSSILLLAALIWGVAFVAQSAGMTYVKPLTFNTARYIVAIAVLIPAVIIMDKSAGKKLSIWGTEDKQSKKAMIIGGVICGGIMAAASTLQQYGILYTTVGKAGFITALYIVIVPLLGIFFKKKLRLTLIISVTVATVGLYFLCMKQNEFSLALGDLLVLLCAVVYSFHIITIDHFAAKVDAVRFSLIQLITAALLSFVPMLILEKPVMGDILDAWLPILYAGALSSGVAYTLQIIGQRGLNPTVASLLMSFEAVFAAIAGSLILKETMTVREIVGCALMFFAIILSQIPQRNVKVN